MCRANTKLMQPGQAFQPSKSGTTAKEVALKRAQQLFADPHASIKEKSQAKQEAELASPTMIVQNPQAELRTDRDPTQHMFSKGDPGAAAFGTKPTKGSRR